MITYEVDLDRDEDTFTAVMHRGHDVEETGTGDTPGAALADLGKRFDAALARRAFHVEECTVANEDLRRRTVIAAETDPDACPNDTLSDLLGLVDRVIAVEVIDDWNAEERKAAEIYAARSHLRANDNAVPVPPEPVCVMLATPTKLRSRADRGRLIEAMRELGRPLEEIAEVARLT